MRVTDCAEVSDFSPDGLDIVLRRENVRIDYLRTNQDPEGYGGQQLCNTFICSRGNCLRGGRIMFCDQLPVVAENYGKLLLLG